MHFELAQNVFARRFDDELVVLELKTGTYYGLDDLGARVFERLTSGRSLDEVVTELEALYDVSLAQLQSDVEALVRSLVGAGVIVARPCASDGDDVTGPAGSSTPPGDAV